MSNLETTLKNIQNVELIDSSVDHPYYFPIDLSVSNNELSKHNLGTAADFQRYVENILASNNSTVAYGGYKEERNLYKKSPIFKNNKTEERNIHLGIDLWTKAGTNVLSALDGTIHSFKNNVGLGDYGPTIILEHRLENQQFYTLYGHLALESLENLKIGAFFKKGEQLAVLGEASVNGNYAPHLHFQIIKNLGNNFGDYPGVCSKKDLAFYLENCPDPNLLLKIQA
ncbi:peptidoglycan DD-metalloendopeptidase family protein [Flavobacterium acetivorans]|uniref:peptidoglycan DD-metalloendopeptidase family protein n=1 Tax=Flavobacterium acetivorans TaxID=2893883 RepID=UPI001E33F708|nr:peptidoglycan DD-metalloendopeptidase family protein [Flavobacterium sp. F-29]UFH34621.1 peptidoglycan DD-metalloendopeptidase family protein [Flavobacterium sp. F-29]